MSRKNGNKWRARFHKVFGAAKSSSPTIAAVRQRPARQTYGNVGAREPGSDDDDESPPTWLPDLLRRDREREEEAKRDAAAKVDSKP